MAAYSICFSVPDFYGYSAATSHITNQRHAQRDSKSVATSHGLNVSWQSINMKCAFVMVFYSCMYFWTVDTNLCWYLVSVILSLSTVQKLFVCVLSS